MAEPMSGKRHRQSKSEHKKRPRHEDEYEAVEESRKHKKSKKHGESQLNNKNSEYVSKRGAFEPKHRDGSPAETGTELVTKKSNKKHRKHEDEDEEPAADLEGIPEAPQEDETKVKKKKKKDKGRVGDDFEDCVYRGPVSPGKKKKKSNKTRDNEQPLGERADDDWIAIEETIEASSPKRGMVRSKKDKRDRIRKESPQSAKDPEPHVDEEQGNNPKRKEKRKGAKTRSSPNPFTRSIEDGVDAMDVDTPKTCGTTTSQAAAELPFDPSFPFYTQTVSLYVPFYPVGFDKPITNVTSQHLEPLLNHYSPLLGGVLLGYRNVNLSEKPIRADPKNPPDDHTVHAVLVSVDEYAVGFGWLTADVDLFVPRRGTWMEGTVNLQSEGHVGVVCWNKFNASIEAKRLPAGWRWVDLTGPTKKKIYNGRIHQGDQGEDEEEQQQSQQREEAEETEETDALDGVSLQLPELHSTGYWVDASGRRATAAPIRFRIKNFDVGISGEYGYLSIEGTMLPDEKEKALAMQERETERRRRQKQNPSGLLRPMSRRVPEFSMTRFGKEEEEEDSATRAVLYKGSRPGTPDD